MTTEFVDVDVRPILRTGGEPFSVTPSGVRTSTNPSNAIT